MSNPSFSFTSDSVTQIKDIIMGYATDVQKVFDCFQSKLIEQMSDQYYLKLRNAVEGLICLYNDTIRGELKGTVLSCWENACQSMTDYVEDMGMGEESLRAAESIEETLFAIFDLSMENRLSELSAADRLGASITNFEEIRGSFRSAAREVQELSQVFLREVENYGEDNSVYAFLTPVAAAYSSGIVHFFECADGKLGELEQNYADKLANARVRAKEPHPDTKFSETDDLAMFVYPGMAKRKSTTSPPCSPPPPPVLSPTDAPSEYFSQGLYEDLLHLFADYCAAGDSMLRDFLSRSVQMLRARGVADARFHLSRLAIGSTRAAFCDTDFFQAMNIAVRRADIDRREEIAANTQSKRLVLSFQEQKNTSFQDRHRYALFIQKHPGGVRVSETQFPPLSAQGLPVRLLAAAGKQRVLDGRLEQQLRARLQAESARDYVLPVFYFEAQLFRGFYQKAAQTINELLGTDELTLDPRYGPYVLPDIPSAIGALVPPVRPSTPPWIDAATRLHFATSRGKRGKPEKVLPNVRYFYQVSAKASSGECWYEKTGHFPYTTYYCYETDSLGRIVHAFTDSLVLAEGVRVGGQQKAASLYQEDDGGHIFRTDFGGSPYIDNILSQHTAINMKKSNEFNRVAAQYEYEHGIGKKRARDVINRGGQWYSLEETWKTELANRIVSVDIEILYQGDEMRPSEYQTITKLADPADGSVQDIKVLSITNPKIDPARLADPKAPLELDQIHTLVSLQKANVCEHCGAVVRVHVDYETDAAGSMRRAVPKFYCPVCKKKVKGTRKLTI